VELRGQDLRTLAEFDVEPGQTQYFVLTHSPSHLPVHKAIDPLAALARTESLWRSWSERSAPAEPWSAAVRQSLIVLKALTYRPTGGIIAAPTTSLPEQFGGVRNWDYRYCWLRDATLTLMALMNGGYFGEARDWRDWLLRAVAGTPSQMRIMYGLAGERRLTEWEVPWLPGYEGASPVRIGNAAADQFQLDVYGEVVDALFQARRGDIPDSPESWHIQCVLLEHLEKIWQTPDEGIWEIRGPRRHFTHSKVMTWVAFDRMIRTAEADSRTAPLDHWRALRQAIHDHICANAFDPGLGSFVQSYGSKQLDAALLLLPQVGFLPISDPRIRGTIEAIERRLMVDGLLRRYDTESDVDGLPPGEGAFLACSFWLADCMVLLGRHADARALFERLLALRNDLGLLAEMYDPGARRLLGNFPQAFSHVALVNTALNLCRAEGPADQRAH
jgi:GH15 family glucan-1,4-alpha-glucosidase